MKKYLKRIICIIICTFIIINLMAVMAISFPSGYYDGTYQSILRKKFDVLKNTDEPKIIIIGGSNAGFGIDEQYIEEKTGYKVANLGLHAGFGGIILLELFPQTQHVIQDLQPYIPFFLQYIVHLFQIRHWIPL